VTLVVPSPNRSKLARLINGAAGLALGVWSPSGGGKLAAAALASLTILGLTASMTLPHHPVGGGAKAGLARAQGGRIPSASLALLSPVNLAVPPQVYQQLTPQQAAAANASIPFSALSNPAAKAFKFVASAPEDRARAVGCLTMAVYYEAASESAEGQAAVAQVVLNRLRHPLFPKTVCGVVFQGSNLSTGCQFTFTCDGSLARRPSPVGWKRASEIAERALDGSVMKAVGEATHYHTMWVVPYWQPTLVKLTQIGAHIFYRWSGEAGRPGSFQGVYAGLEPAPPAIEGVDNGAAVLTVASLTPPPPPVAAPAIDAAPPVSAQSVGVDGAATVQQAPAPPPAVAPPKPKRVGFFGSSSGAPVANHLAW
jgi:spore germination cell wall hydrolase CwlJ-like protein